MRATRLRDGPPLTAAGDEEEYTMAVSQTESQRPFQRGLPQDYLGRQVRLLQPSQTKVGYIEITLSVRPSVSPDLNSLLPC